MTIVVKAVGLSGLVQAYGFEGLHAFADEAKPAKVTATPVPEVWTSKHMVVNKNSNVVHWPHPRLYKAEYRVAPHNAETLKVDEWDGKVGKDSKYRFDKSKSGVIYENLALREIVIEDEETYTFNNGSIGESIEVLKIAVSDPANSDNWRLYELMGRLVSLKHEDDPEKARAEFVEILNASAIHSSWKNKDPLSRANDKEKFKKWHAKTTDKKHGEYRKKLSKRVKSSKELI